MLRNVDFQRQNSRINYSSEYVSLTRTTVGFFNGIDTFLADPNVDLTEWDVANEITLTIICGLFATRMVHVKNSAVPTANAAMFQMSL